MDINEAFGTELEGCTGKALASFAIYACQARHGSYQDTDHACLQCIADTLLLREGVLDILVTGIEVGAHCVGKLSEDDTIVEACHHVDHACHDLAEQLLSTRQSLTRFEA